VKKKHAQQFFSSSLAIIVGCDIGVNVCRLQFVPLDGASKKFNRVIDLTVYLNSDLKIDNNSILKQIFIIRFEKII
jgi:hypothetical protein